MPGLRALTGHILGGQDLIIIETQGYGSTYKVSRAFDGQEDGRWILMLLDGLPCIIHGCGLH